MSKTDKSKPVITTAGGNRQLAGSPVAVMGIIVNVKEQILLMAHPDLNWGWQVINGALEAGETVLEGVLRETHEEAGTSIQVRPLGTVHVNSFHYDKKVRFMLGITYLLAYEGGKIVPGDDMEGSQYRWWSLEEIESEAIKLIIPPEGGWLLARAVELYRLWNRRNFSAAPGFNLSLRGKSN